MAQSFDICQHIVHLHFVLRLIHTPTLSYSLWPRTVYPIISPSAMRGVGRWLEEEKVQNYSDSLPWSLDNVTQVIVFLLDFYFFLDGYTFEGAIHCFSSHELIPNFASANTCSSVVPLTKQIVATSCCFSFLGFLLHFSLPLWPVQ